MAAQRAGLFMKSELYKITNFVHFAVAACGLLFCKVRTAFIVPGFALLPFVRSRP